MSNYLRRGPSVPAEQRFEAQATGLPGQFFPHFSLPSDTDPEHLESARALAREIGAAIASDGNIAVSIAMGLTTLEQAFHTLTDEVDLDTPATIIASRQIVEAVETVGLEDWLVVLRGAQMDTYQHCMAVAGVAAWFGLKAGLVREDIVRLTLAALLHDIGKARVPLTILNKPGPLTPEELIILRRHPRDGYDHLKDHSVVEPPVMATVRDHHEMLDGSGYPEQLRDEAIDDITRVVTICDIYAAVVERRSYKSARSPREGLQVLSEMAEAGKLDTDLVAEFTAIMAPA